MQAPLLLHAAIVALLRAMPAVTQTVGAAAPTSRGTAGGRGTCVRYDWVEMGGTGFNTWLMVFVNSFGSQMESKLR